MHAALLLQQILLCRLLRRACIQAVFFSHESTQPSLVPVPAVCSARPLPEPHILQAGDAAAEQPESKKQQKPVATKGTASAPEQPTGQRRCSLVVCCALQGAHKPLTEPDVSSVHDCRAHQVAV